MIERDTAPIHAADGLPLVGRLLGDKVVRVVHVGAEGFQAIGRGERRAFIPDVRSALDLVSFVRIVPWDDGKEVEVTSPDQLAPGSGSPVSWGSGAAAAYTKVPY